MESYWRKLAMQVASAAREEGEASGLTGKALERFVRSRRPSWTRSSWPYKVWLSEVRFQLGLGPTKSRLAKLDRSSPGQLALLMVDEPP